MGESSKAVKIKSEKLYLLRMRSLRCFHDLVPKDAVW